MNYDTAAALASLEPPTFTHEGVTWTGRFLSIREWMVHQGKADRLEQGLMTLPQILRFHRDLVEVFFPGPKLGWWRRRGESPIWEAFGHLPLVVQTDAIKSFLRSQAKAFGLKMENPEPGTRSSGDRKSVV